MNKNYIYIFLIGVVSGVVPAWYITKKKYERVAQEEIDSVKEEFRKKTDKLCKKYDSEHVEKGDKPETADHKTVVDGEILAYKRDTSRVDYTRFSKDPPEEVIVEVGSPNMPPEAKPYIIPPEDFGFEDYEPITLTYYKDGVLTDEDDEPVENPDDIVGSDYDSHFGEFDHDVVYVRNERMKCDYEILRDERRYGEIVEQKPYLADKLAAMMDVDDS